MQIEARLSHEQARSLAQFVESRVQGHRCLVLDNGLQLAAVRPCSMVEAAR
jgi:hypothetical protein